jgi:hypothetical protein
MVQYHWAKQMAKPYRNPIVAGHTRLFHYERFNPDWLTTTLREQTIHCSNPNHLNDPWDCTPCFDDQSLQTEADLDEFFLWLSQTTGRSFPDIQQKARADGVYASPLKMKEHLAQFSATNLKKISELRIYCLTPDPLSTLMWSHYADNHKGICLEFRTDNNFLLPSAQEVIYRSKYPKWKPQQLSDVALEMILTKADAWSYEKEFRLIGHPDRSGHLRIEGECFRLPPDTLASVVVGCQGDFDAVRAITTRYAPGLPIKRTIRTPNHYTLTLQDDDLAST